jgi:hypothetical protein
LVLTGCEQQGESRRIDTGIIDIPLSAKDKDMKKEMAVITFETAEINAGRMLQGDVRNYSFSFENTGSAPLIISGISASCGCTVPKNYPRGKILPGESGVIEVRYDSDGKWGEMVSVIGVSTNAMPPRTELIIRAEVIAPNKP